MTFLDLETTFLKLKPTTAFLYRFVLQLCNSHCSFSICDLSRPSVLFHAYWGTELFIYSATFWKNEIDSHLMEEFLPGFPKYVHVVVIFYVLYSNRGFIENIVSPSYTMYVILFTFREDDY